MRKTKTWVVVTICVLVAGLMAGLGFFLDKDRRNTRKPFAESTAQKHQESVSAFSPNPPTITGVTSQDRTAISGIFGSIASANSQQNYFLISSHYDIERAIDEIGAAAGEEGQTLLKNKSFRTGFEKGMQQQFSKQNEAYTWTLYDLRFVRPWAGTTDEVVVYAAVHDPGAPAERMRWWLRKKDGQWKIYDYEDLRYGLRGSAVMGALLRKDFVDNPGTMSRVTAAMTTIRTGRQQLVAGQYDSAAKSFASAADPALPKPFEALRLTLLASARVGEEKYDDALALAQQSAQLKSDLPLNDLIVAKAHNGLDDPDKALAALDRYESAVGVDAFSAAARGEALAANGETQDAIKWFRRGLDEQADSPENFSGLCRLLGLKGLAELRVRIAKIADPSPILELAANDAINRRHTDELEAVAALYRHLGKTDSDPMAAYAEAEVHVLKRNWPEAVKAFKRRLDVMHSSTKTHGAADRELAYALIYSKHEIEGYQTHTDKRAAIVLAGDELFTAGDAETLTKLVEMHRVNDPQDAVRLHYYTGAIAELKHKLADAEKEYRTALPLAGSDEWREPLHRSLVRVLFDSDRIAEAYNTVGPRKQTVNELISLARTRERPAALRQIADLVEADTPNDLMAVKYRADAAWMEKDYARCAQVLLPRSRELLARDDLSWLVRNILIRSLVKTNRAAEALNIARQSTHKDWTVDYLLALSAAAAGDAATAIPELDKWLSSTDAYDPASRFGSLLEDEDFARALKAPQFADWLRRQQVKAGPPSPTSGTSSATRPASR